MSTAPILSESIDVRSFWSIIGQRATGVTVVTAKGPEGPAGFLGFSASHVSASPPLMLVSIDKKTSARSAVLDGRNFALNYLPAGARAIAEVFGGNSDLKGANRFEPGPWSELRTGAPVLIGALAAIDCVLEETIDRDGVSIMIGRVVATAVDLGRAPLIAFRGSYFDWP
ncbi:flavin reductase family protein [Terrarubrum flagellatum]|uniref:flavin reductase family protein n=1 Tax=Terrirubrum flagellatum TaxID=2895980 RepID=UPI0031454925